MAATFRPKDLLVVVTLLVASACGNAAPDGSDGFPGAKIGFVFVGQRDDFGYNQAAWEGSEEVARAFPDHLVLRLENVPESPRAETAMETLIRQGARIIFATSYGHLPFAVNVAKRHPDVIVLHQGGIEPKPKLANFGTYWGTVYEPVYLAGIAAGKATRTGKLGYVVAFPIPATFNNVNAFALGARSVNAQATVDVVFTGDWCDPAKQRDAATRLLAQGADLLAQHQDCTSTILRAAEAAGALAVGYHYDASDVAPGSWLIGPVWNWGPLFVDIARTILAGTFARSEYDADFVGGLRTEDNPFVLTEPGPRVDPAALDAIQAAEKRFRSGGSPFEGPLADREGTERFPAGVTPTYAETLRMDYFVPGVVGDVPR